MSLVMGFDKVSLDELFVTYNAPADDAFNHLLPGNLTALGDSWPIKSTT